MNVTTGKVEVPLQNMIERNESFRAELKSRREEEKKYVCNEPDILHLMEVLGYEDMIDSLDMSEEDFMDIYQVELPAIAIDRNELRNFIELHLQNCSRCQIVRKNEIWLDQKVEGFLKLDQPLFEKKQNINFVEVLSSLTATIFGIHSRAVAGALIVVAAFYISVSWLGRGEDAQLDAANNSTNVESKSPESSSDLKSGSTGAPERLYTPPARSHNKSTPTRLPKTRAVSDVLIARAQKVELDTIPSYLDIRDAVGPDHKDTVIKIVPARTQPTTIQISLPEGSKKGAYIISIRELAFAKPLVTKKSVSTNGKSLLVALDIRNLSKNKYWLQVRHESEIPGDYIIQIEPKETDKHDMTTTP